MCVIEAVFFADPNKNTQIYSNFHNFELLKVFAIFCVLSALGFKEPPLGLDDRLLHSF